MAKTVTLRENWAGGMDEPPWDNWGGGHVDVAGGVVSVESDATNDANYFGFASDATYDLTDSEATIEIVSLPTFNVLDSTISAVVLGVEVDSNNRVMWNWSLDGLVAYIVIAGDYIPVGILTYNAAVHNYLRIREEGGFIYFGYSADGLTWDEPYVTNYVGLTITAMTIGASIGAWSDTAFGPYTMELGDVNLTPIASTFVWKGYTWTRRTDYGAPHYTGNWLAANVINPDGQDRVVLRLTNPTGAEPFAAEFLGAGDWGYGTYIVTTEVAASMLTNHKSIVSGGLFTYGSNTPHHNEIDVNEVSAWGVTADPVGIGHNVWYDNGGANAVNGDTDTVDAALVQTHRLVWTPGSIVIDSFVGSDTSGVPYFTSTFTEPGDEIPVPDDEVPHFNLWVGNYGDADETTAGPYEIAYLNFYFSPYSGGGGGGIKVFNGTEFEVKPIKVWNGSAWVEKPLKRWNGTAWVETS